MATLHEALQCLSATTWDAVPTDPAALRAYMADISAKAHLIVNSVPEQPPPPPPPSDKEHTHTHTHTPYPPTPSSPTAPQITPSPTRLNTPDPALQTLHQEWGKPIKVSSTRDNPLDIPVYKLSGADGRGSWFGRRSIHQGLPFARWQEKLSSEMLVTLAANEERLGEGKVADQAVRGIGAERRVERVEVRDGDGGVVGHVGVFHVSAQFPRPTTPRDFVALILDWEVGGDDGGGGGGGRGGRNWMMVSRPCLHPDVPDRSGFIRGEYESVEFIREVVPGREAGAIASAESARGRSPGETAINAKEGGQVVDGANEEINPVEWIMVTRSDPGGNIPRWMVEKGTPKSICSDAAKFIDWACREPDATAGESTTNNMRKTTGPSRRGSQHTAGVERETDDSDSDMSDLGNVEHHGLIASFAYLLNSGVERYAPQAVLDYLPQHSRHSSALSRPDSSISQHSDGAFKTPSGQSITDVNNTTATTKTTAADAKSQVSQSKASSSASATSGLVTPILEAGDHNIPPEELLKTDKKGKMSSHEKQLVKLAQQKRDVEGQLDRVRADIQSLNTNTAAAAATPPPRDEVSKRDKASTTALAAAGGGDATISDQASSSAASTNPPPRPPSTQSETKSKKDSKSKKKDKKDANPEEVKIKKVAPKLFHDESKLLKQLGKIEKSQVKEASKIEARMKKDAAQEEKSRSRTEHDYLRHENEHLKKEIERLRGERKQWLDLIGTLQDDNKELAKRCSGEKARD
ncbi:hypothetical protein P168DRAFT_310873 [Aspergillus campestris IBT 28561]|uniref:DUF3074 domain-containing protein n=1 Tax=Aspergillus campestris (strain IBT 28561) TaxID=1392248 RepID=A0A2I1D2Y5_ASPC2|nr:uncharacterized protein P168DRAFT_310873 [Aspergillus campestris IBT 28561]PKY04246.1 hypothetical protein P168DRAFT_310873 [Aspergillus campestris IBT 28561]